jgi:hypothetical protein
LNVLIIADDPESTLFHQISILEDAIKETGANVDSLIFSTRGAFFNKRKLQKKRHAEAYLLEPILNEKAYVLIAVSLGLSNLKKLFLEEPNALHFSKKFAPEARMYVFGASSILCKIKRDSNVSPFVYPRPGVARLTREFKDDLVNYLKKRAVKKRYP